MADITNLSQNDPSWKADLLGNSTLTLGMYGCMLTSMTMVANCYGFNETPDTLNAKMKAVGGFQGALLVYGRIVQALPGMKFLSFSTNPSGQNAPLAEIDASLAMGKPVVIEVDYSPNPGVQMHWVVLYGKSGSDYLMHDPYPYPIENRPVTLASRYGFAGDPSKVIQAALFLDGPKSPVAPPAPGPQPPVTPSVTASFPVYAAADALALRSQPLVADDTLIERVSLNTKFTALESDDAVHAKMGVVNQWLLVKSPDGKNGYAAAWYLSTALTDPATPDDPSHHASPTTPLVIKTTSDALALRSQPAVDPSNLIKRLAINSTLQVLEPAAQAQAKIGVDGQWLNVKDITGVAGYIAAWFVAAADAGAALGVLPRLSAPASYKIARSRKPEPALVRAGVEGLALRRRPVITARSLIKRLPYQTDLLSLEPAETVLNKLGKVGQWLHVKDVSGQKGYVAAWYAVRHPGPVTGEGKDLPG